MAIADATEGARRRSTVTTEMGRTALLRDESGCKAVNVRASTSFGGVARAARNECRFIEPRCCRSATFFSPRAIAAGGNFFKRHVSGCA
jgi:hypothetical protein